MELSTGGVASGVVFAATAYLFAALLLGGYAGWVLARLRGTAIEVQRLERSDTDAGHAGDG